MTSKEPQKKHLSEELSPEELLARAYALETQEEAKALYADWAKTYDETMIGQLGYVTPRKTAAMLSEVLPDKTIPILDVGSGTGLAGAFLAKSGCTQVDALDYSKAMLSVAQVREVDGQLVYGKIIEADLSMPLDIASEAYSALIATGIFTHAHVGADCLGELFRILKPGGFFACTVHHDVWNSAGFAEATRRLADNKILRTHGMTSGIYFETDDEPQGYYILWEKVT